MGIIIFLLLLVIVFREMKIIGMTDEIDNLKWENKKLDVLLTATVGKLYEKG